MAGYKRSYYNYNPYQSAAVKRAKGNLKAAARGTDTATFTVPVNHNFFLSGKTVYYNPTTGVTSSSSGSGFNPVNYGLYAINIYDILSKADNFNNYKKMYDSFRLDYVQVKLAVTNSTINTSNTGMTYDLYTAWDRTGLSEGDYTKVVANNTASTAIDGFAIVQDNIDEIAGNSKLTLNAFQRWKTTKTIWPQKGNSAEKDYINCADIKDWHDNVNSTNLYYPIKNEFKPTNATWKEWLNSNNPCLLVENSKYAFKPTLLIAAYETKMNGGVAEKAILSSSTQIVMSAEIKCVITFKGPKGGPTV